MSSALTSPTETMPRPSPLPAGDRGEARSTLSDDRSGNRPETAPSRQNQSQNRSQPSRAESQEISGRKGPSGDGGETEAVKDAVADLQRQLSTSLEFEVDEELDRAIVRVRNPETGDVIRQIPPEEMLAVARQLRENQGDEPQGMLLDVQR